VSLRISCPHCRVLLQFEMVLTSRVLIACPRCRREFFLEPEDDPVLVAELVDEDAADEPIATLLKADHDEPPRRSRRSRSRRYRDEDSWDEDREYEEERARRRKRAREELTGLSWLNYTLGFVWSGLVFAGYLISGAVMGFYDWSIMQIVMTILVLNSDRVGWAKLLSGHIDRLVRYYEDDPRRVGCLFQMLCWIPCANWILMPKAYILSLLIVLIGLPLDLSVSYVMNYVLHIPRWALGQMMDYWSGFWWATWFSFAVTPYMVMFIVHIKRRSRD
jgi:hypothetical protein